MSITVKRILLVLLVANILQGVVAQTDGCPKAFPVLQYSVYGGKLIQHRDVMKKMGDKPYFGNDIRLMFQTTGSKYLHKKYNYPSYGIGFYSGYYNNKIIGNPFAVFGALELPFIRKDKYSLSTGWGVGLSFNLNEYDSITNPLNMVVSTDLNVYVGFDFVFKYHLSDRFDIGTGIKYQHFSNGSIRKPNLGLNMVTGQLLIAYLPKKRTPFCTDEISEPKYKKHEFAAFYGLGWRGEEKLSSKKRFLNTVLSLSISRRVNFKRNVGLGFDFSYNSYIIQGREHELSKKAKDLMSYSVFVSSDLIVGKFRIAAQVGTYLYQPVKYSEPIYERVALRYYFIENAFLNVSIKAHYASAQCVEWGIGFAL